MLDFAQFLVANRLTQSTTNDRRLPDVSRGMTPQLVDRIFQMANSGDPRLQARLGLEMLEKDWDIAQAVQTRVTAVCGTPWEIQPGADSDLARRVAGFVREVLQDVDGLAGEHALEGMHGLTTGLMRALLPGYSVNEIVWLDGGRRIAGFQHVEAHHFRFDETFAPRLTTRDEPTGMALPAARFVVHRTQPGNDPTRGGLIRPLAWLFVFKNLHFKDLLRYLEKYGMPFLLARLDDQAFDQERHKIVELVRHFGSDGGGVFTKSTDLEMLQPNHGGSEAYFDFLAYCERAIIKVVLGQTSTSDSRDSNRSTAEVHNMVRQEIRQEDCRALAETLRRDLLRPLVRFNYGPQAPVPRLSFQYLPPLDRERESRVLANLRQAGYAVSADAVASAFGYPVTATG